MLCFLHFINVKTTSHISKTYNVDTKIFAFLLENYQRKRLYIYWCDICEPFLLWDINLITSDDKRR